MKRKILFVSYGLGKGGSAKVLLSMLSVLDYEKYDVTLKLFSNELNEKVPDDVKVEFHQTSRGFTKQLLLAKQNKILPTYLKDKFLNLFSIRHGHADYQKILDAFLCDEMIDTQSYDVAIAASELLPTYYVASCVPNAKKRVAWLHIDYQAMKVAKEIDKKYYDQLDAVATINKDCLESFLEVYPEYKQKTEVIENVVLKEEILEKAECSRKLFDGSINLVTVSRLNNPHKRMDRAVKACRYLLDAGVPVKWYYIGDGPDRKKTEAFIRKNHLNGRFVLLGEMDNPYPYMKQADLFVLLSQYEGKPLVVTESMLLSCPVVVTQYRSAKEQVEESWGYILPNQDEGLNERLLAVVKDTTLQAQKRQNLESFRVDNTVSLEQIERLLSL